ncbi:glyoxalase/bleomycin resistance/extradiol dioxygenase family protein [uncultured Muriicola sp.]|uniref:glyoxalase/bleomycin resistance/extradiol dioxygenase family protein n=1 Tax=uncultured Muriicola sp. TaxID=1583102 RepID=UPI00262792B3|nr:glyoxalase/bleomycin resistance/extradiol dioxygenase family protein [uncultured Muriicola sp.]
MKQASSALYIVPVLPSLDIERDIKWYEKYTGFTYCFGDKCYAGLQRENLEFHLQFHLGTAEDPISGGSVMKLFVSDIYPYVEEFVNRGTISSDKLRENTSWGTHEFGFYDLNKNAIFIVQDV